MTLVLCRRLNHRNIELRADTRGEVVGVLRRNGDYGFVPWLGFIDRAEARRTGRPVKLLIARIGTGTASPRTGATCGWVLTCRVVSQTEVPLPWLIRR